MSIKKWKKLIIGMSEKGLFSFALNIIIKIYTKDY
jgi:hypothetical protein